MAASSGPAPLPYQPSRGHLAALNREICLSAERHQVLEHTRPKVTQEGLADTGDHLDHGATEIAIQQPEPTRGLERILAPAAP